MDQEEKQRFFGSLVFPAFLLVLIWLIKLVEVGFQVSFADYGLIPQTLIGIRGIFFSPLLHADWSHLSSNSVPLFLLTAGLFYYYGKKSWTIFALCWLVTGLWVWIFARGTGVHIGASGVVYALATFHFTGGVLRREPRMMSFALLVVFLYGGLVWGISPEFSPGKNISWQSHLLGGVAGILIAFAYKDIGPQRIIYQWDEEDDDIEYFEEDETKENVAAVQKTEDEIKPVDTENEQNLMKINYIYKENRIE
ncbi:MAG: rhomboid family intramembrane serine protease [Bacteroidales bacterium]